MYADTDFWVALLKDDDWLAQQAEARLAEFEGELEVSLATFIELFLISERYGFDRERAALAVFELVESDVDPDIVFQAAAYMDDGLDTLDAFHAALAGEAILSSDRAFDTLALDRVRLEPDDVA